MTEGFVHISCTSARYTYSLFFSKGGYVRRQREWRDIIADPKTPYMIGRLIGASEMASALLAQEGESANAQKIGEVLREIGAFFMEQPPE